MLCSHIFLLLLFLLYFYNKELDDLATHKDRVIWQPFYAVDALLLSRWLSSLSVSLQQSTFERTLEQTGRRFLCWNLIC